MDNYFFSGSSISKLDEKSRFVLPQHLRYALVEDAKLEFYISLGLGGCLSIYRKSEIQKIVQKFKTKQHLAQYQKFFTLFFSTLHLATCDKVGRVNLPSYLKNAIKIEKEIVIAGVLNKIELWPKEVYDKNLSALLDDNETKEDLSKMMESAFALLDEDPPVSKQEDQNKATVHCNNSEDTLTKLSKTDFSIIDETKDANATDEN